MARNEWQEISCRKYCFKNQHDRLRCECAEIDDHELRIDYDIAEDYYYEHNFLDDK